MMWGRHDLRNIEILIQASIHRKKTGTETFEKSRERVVREREVWREGE
jgi:hypothetical protein